MAVSIDPTTASILVSQTQQFTATVTGNSNTSVTWSITEGSTGGTVSDTGLYTASSTAGTYHVVATSVADTSKSASATVTVADGVGITVSPTTDSLLAGMPDQTYTATVTGNADTTYAWAITESSGCGSIVAGTGVYTPPATASGTVTCHLVATATADNTKSATTTVTVNPAIDMTSSAIDLGFGAAAFHGAGGSAVTGYGSTVQDVYLASDNTNLYVVVTMAPRPNSNNMYVFVDDTAISTGITDLSLDPTATGTLTVGQNAGYGALGSPGRPVANTAGLNVDYAQVGYFAGDGTLNLDGQKHNNIVSGVSTAVGDLPNKSDISSSTSANYKFAIPYANIGGGSAKGHAIKVYVFFGKSHEYSGDHGIHSMAPAPAQAQIDLMSDGSGDGLTDVTAAAPDYLLK